MVCLPLPGSLPSDPVGKPGNYQPVLRAGASSQSLQSASPPGLAKVVSLRRHYLECHMCFLEAAKGLGQLFPSLLLRLHPDSLTTAGKGTFLFVRWSWGWSGIPAQGLLAATVHFRRKSLFVTSPE